MGRIVACKKCGRWVELEAGQKPRDFLCQNCSGGAVATEPAAEAPAAPLAARGRVASIGPDSGAIGSSVGGAAAVTDLSAQLEQMHARSDALKVDTTGLDEASRRLNSLSQQAARSESPELAELRSRGVEALDFAREKAAHGLDRAKEMAGDFAREQAVRTTEAARDMVKEKGLGAVTELDDFAKEQGRRIGSEAIKRVEEQLKSTADQAAEAVREAAGQQRRGKKRVVRRDHAPQQQDVCKLCQDPIVSGDRVTVCPKCGSRYHLQCYTMLGGCVSPECKAAGPVQPPDGRAAPKAQAKDIPIALAPEKKPQAVRRCVTCGAQVGRGALVCPQCGRWLYSGRTKGDPRMRRKQGGSPLGCSSSVLLLAAGIGAVLLWLVAT